MTLSTLTSSGIPSSTSNLGAQRPSAHDEVRRLLGAAEALAWDLMDPEKRVTALCAIADRYIQLDARL